jgi:hypothetical protein
VTVWLEDDDVSWFDEDAYRELRDRVDKEVDRRLFFGDDTVRYGVVFDVASAIATEDMIQEAVDDMHDVADYFRLCDDLRWTDYAEWDEVPLMDTLFDIRSLDGSGVEPEVCMVLPTRLYERRRHGA